MTKTQALAIFGTTRSLADALGITRSAVSQWPEDLPPRLVDEIVGAALRCRLVSLEVAMEWLCAPADQCGGSAPSAPMLDAVRRSG